MNKHIINTILVNLLAMEARIIRTQNNDKLVDIKADIDRIQKTLSDIEDTLTLQYTHTED